VEETDCQSKVELPPYDGDDHEKAPIVHHRNEIAIADCKEGNDSNPHTVCISNDLEW